MCIFSGEGRINCRKQKSNRKFKISNLKSPMNPGNRFYLREYTS